MIIRSYSFALIHANNISFLLVIPFCRLIYATMPKSYFNFSYTIYKYDISISNLLNLSVQIWDMNKCVLCVCMA